MRLGDLQVGNHLYSASIVPDPHMLCFLRTPAALPVHYAPGRDILRPYRAQKMIERNLAPHVALGGRRLPRSTWYHDLDYWPMWQPNR
jgi:hypothetical protein